MSALGSSAAITPRFASASAAASQSVSVSPERAAEISAKRDRVSERAETHFEQSRQKWTNRQYGELLANDGERLTLRPAGMVDDRKEHLMRAADYMVRQKQANRMARIERAAGNLLSENQRGNARGIGR
jgi:hypothetical protein